VTVIAATVRTERPADAVAVRTVLQAAFAGSLEADMVERLRDGGDLVLALVADRPECLAGYVAFPRLVLRSDDRAVPAVGLAPLGVLPQWQRQGIGGALVREGLARLRAAGEALVCVLGDPAYYRRFGFAAAPDFVSRYAGPYFQVQRLARGAPSGGAVSYPKPFDDLG
jgi:putative acetyltransferase